MQQPEAYIGGAAQLFNADGKITNEATREFLIKFINAFAAWVAKNSSKNP
jgi:chromate reductase